jgi:hypothetical protein
MPLASCSFDAALRRGPPHDLPGRSAVPVMAVQTTYNNEQRERLPMSKGQTTPYLDMLRAAIPTARVEIIEDTGQFPQIDESGQTNALLDNFLGSLSAR